MKQAAISPAYRSFYTDRQRRPMSVKDPGSAITHFIGLILSALGAIPLMMRAASHSQMVYSVSMGIFIASMILLYAASSAYHTFDISPSVNRRLKKLDHMMISVLIAGSYTPVCLLVLKGRLGILLLSIIWGLAISGILIKAFWVYCPKWFSSILYIGMGWTCVLAFGPLVRALPPTAFLLLLSGGIIYTIGGVIYALKLPGFDSRHPNFGTHEIFHLFVMGGSLCHYLLMLLFL